MHGQHTTEELELAWAAGFFDGEGSTSVMAVSDRRGRPKNYMYIQVSVRQVRREPLDRFWAAVGVGNITLYANRNWQKVFSWQASGSPGRQALDRLWPYLSIPKREQAERVFARVADHLEQHPPDHFKRLRARIVQLHADGLTAVQIGNAVGRDRRTIYYHLRKAREQGR